jgi:Na+-driven multidrug efflux pump
MVGSRDIKAAKFYSKVLTTSAVCWAMLNLLVLNLLKDTLLGLFNSTDEVNNLIE